MGLEPTTPGLEVRCAIHCATLTDNYLHILFALEAHQLSQTLFYQIIFQSAFSARILSLNHLHNKTKQILAFLKFKTLNYYIKKK